MQSSQGVRKNLNTGSSLVVMLLWGLCLAYPMHQLQYARWQFLGYGVPVYYFFTVFLLAGVAALALACKREWRGWELVWWLLPLICLPAIMHSDDRLWSIRQWLSWMIRGVIPGGIIFLAGRQNKVDSMLLYWIFPVIIAASLLGLTEIFCGYNPIWKGFDNVIPDTGQPASPFYRPGYEMAPVNEPRGTQGNRIPYASTLVGFVPIGLWLLKYNKRHNWLQVPAVGVLFSILLMARVRSVWLGTLTSLILMYAVGLLGSRRETMKIFTGALLGLTVLLALPQARNMVWSRLHSFHLTEHSIQNRLELLETAAILKRRGFLGVGYGQYAAACDPYYRGERWLPYFHGETWTGTPDNQYLRWAIENGIPSLVLLLMFLGGLVRAGWKKILLISDARQADFYKAILVGWLSVAVTFLFFDGFYWGACNMTFWCFLGLFATCLKSPQSPVAQKEYNYTHAA